MLADSSDLPRVKLEARLVAVQSDEIAWLTELKGNPSIKPSGMEDRTEPKRPGTKRGKRCGRGKVTPLVSVERAQ